MDATKVFDTIYDVKKPLPETKDLSSEPVDDRAQDIRSKYWLGKYVEDQNAKIERLLTICMEHSVKSITPNDDRALINVLIQAETIRTQLNFFLTNK